MRKSKPEKRFWALASRLAAVGLLAAVVACAGTPARNPVPPELTSQAGIEGIPEARFWGDEWPKFSIKRFETYSNGRQYEELHVDGGTGSQVFVYPAAVDWKLIMNKLEVQGEPQVYVVRNAFLEPDYQGLNRSVLPIAIRSIDSLIRTQGIGDLFQIYALCERDGNDFNLAYIPAEFVEEPSEGFDPVYMGKLYELGYQMARKGYPWANAPPGFIQGN